MPTALCGHPGGDDPELVTLHYKKHVSMNDNDLQFAKLGVFSESFKTWGSVTLHALMGRLLYALVLLLLLLLLLILVPILRRHCRSHFDVDWDDFVILILAYCFFLEMERLVAQWYTWVTVSS